MEEKEIKYVWSASSWLMMFTKGPEEKYSWSRSFKTVSTGGGVDGGDVCSSGSGVGCLSMSHVVGVVHSFSARFLSPRVRNTTDYLHI